MKVWNLRFVKDDSSGKCRFLFERSILQGTNISRKNGILKMIFLFPRWDMLIPWRVVSCSTLGFQFGVYPILSMPIHLFSIIHH